MGTQSFEESQNTLAFLEEHFRANPIHLLEMIFENASLFRYRQDILELQSAAINSKLMGELPTMTEKKAFGLCQLIQELFETCFLICQMKQEGKIVMQVVE